ncbi:MAG: translation initiation factor IF-3, partial [Micrococcales bacterium]|nr:translation initiation factor IF-3 [Micrococcales bacterium]
RPKIAQHDFDTKKGHVERFLKAGDKVKVMIQFRGREQSRPEAGIRLLSRLAEDVTEFGFVESQPKQDGRNMVMVIAPVKKKAEQRNEARRAAQAKARTDAPEPAPREPAPREPAPAPAPTTPATPDPVPTTSAPATPAPAAPATPAPAQPEPAPRTPRAPAARPARPAAAKTDAPVPRVPAARPSTAKAPPRPGPRPRPPAAKG